MTVTTQNEKLFTVAQYMYDALGQRIRLWEMGKYENKTFNYDALLLFREATVYEINDGARSCVKRSLRGDFQPLAIPKDATLLAQSVLGSSSGPGQGLLINTWTGELPNNAGKYMSTVTEFGCIPVSTVYHTEQFGWVVTSFYNNIIGVSDPGQLNPPDYCQGAETKEESSDFFSVLLNVH